MVAGLLEIIAIIEITIVFLFRSSISLLYCFDHILRSHIVIKRDSYSQVIALGKNQLSVDASLIDSLFCESERFWISILQLGDKL